MKKAYCIIITLTLCLASRMHAATTITAINAAAGGTGFVEQIRFNGAPFTGGIIMSGTFTSVPSATGSITLSNFGWSQFASAPFSTNAVAPGVFGAFGGAGQTLTMTSTLPTTNTGAFVGNNIYLVIANPANNDFIIWNSNIKFAAEDSLLGGAPISIQTRDATLVRGVVLTNGNTGLGGPLAAFNAGGTTGGNAITFVPETSTTLLGAVGALVLLRRRRR